MNLQQSTSRTVKIGPVYVADSLTPVTSFSGAVYKLSKSSDVSFATITPSVTFIGEGSANVTFTAGHTDTIGDLELRVSMPGAVDYTKKYVVIDYDPLHAAGLTNAVAIAVLDAARSGHVIVGSVGEGIALAAALLQGNFYIDNVDNSDPNGPTAQRLRVFHTGVAAQGATQGGSGEGEWATFLVATSYSGPNRVVDHRVVQQ